MLSVDRAPLRGAVRAALVLACVTYLALLQLASAKCLGTACVEMEKKAKQSGLLGATKAPEPSNPQCRGRDRVFAFDKSWRTELQSELLSLAWTGADDEWVWAITSGTTSAMTVGARHVYWSKDHGRTFVDRYDELVKQVTAKAGAGTERLAGVSKVFVNAANQRKVLLWGDGPYAFASEDGGETLELLDLPPNTIGLAHQIRQHPNRHDWLLTLAQRDDCIIGTHFGCAMDLWLTKDFGRQWANLTAAAGGAVAGFLDFDWGIHNSDAKYASLFEEGTILATAHTRQYQSIQSIVQDDVHLYRTDDDFATVKKIASCGAAFALVAGQVFFVHPDVCDMDINGKPAKEKALQTRRDALTLYVSSDGHNFAEVCLPTQLSDAAYTMVSTQDGRGNFVIADHHNKQAAVSNMYANGNIAELYTLSLRNVHFGFRRGSKPDVKSLKPVVGRYIVNVLEPAEGNNPYTIDDRTFNAVTVTKSLISVDPSTVTNKVCKANCPAGQVCYLHLHGASSWVRGSSERPSVYAAPSAPGLVMASGNLGPEKQGLTTDKEQLCTWLSRDGGITWVDLVDDVYIYEYLNHGNILVMAKFREEGPAEFLHVSLDQGQCFYKIRLVAEGSTDEELRVNNILVEPDGAATIAHVAASLYTKSLNKRQDVIITIDVRDVLSKADASGTVLPPRAECDDSDFEEWTVADGLDKALCILGESHTFKRMKRTLGDKGCFLKKDYAFAPYTSQPCACAVEDLYCEYGYEKYNTNSKCTLMSERGDSPPKCHAIENGAYKVSEKHMRLAHGETCPNINTFIPDTDGNGNMQKHEWHMKTQQAQQRKSGKSGGGHFWLWAVVCVVLGVAVVGGFMYGPPAVRDVGSSLAEGGIGVAVWVIDGAKSVFRRAQGERPEELGFERLADSEQESLYAVP